MKISFVILAVMAAFLFAPQQSQAKTFYLKNGDEIEYQSYKLRDGVVYLQINQDSEIEFPEGEVDLAKTAEAAGGKLKTPPVKLKKHEEKRAAGKALKQGVPANEMGMAEPSAAQAGTPSLQQELNAVYGKYFAAMRSGNSREALKYVTGEERKQVEHMDKMPKEQKTQMNAILKAALAGGYKVTGCSASPNGKSATLNLTRKVPSVSYESGKDADGNITAIQKGETVYKDSSGIVDFVKVGNVWKIERRKEM